MIERIFSSMTYWIARMDDNSVIHHGVAEAGQHLSTGLDCLETFETEEEYKVRLADFNITEE